MKRSWSASAASVQPARLAGIAAVWCITLLYVLFQGGKTSLMLFAMMSVLVLYLTLGGIVGVRRARGSRTLASEGDKPDLLQAGGHLRVKLNVTIPGFLPAPYVVVREVLQRHNGESWIFEESFVPNLRGQGELRFQTPTLERGSYRFTDTEIASEDIFGLVEHKGGFLAEGRFGVLPRAVVIPRWQLYDRRAVMAGQQTSLLHSRRETTQINGVRDYVFGDRLSRIHWNATAKTGAWKSKEFEHEALPKTVLVLDGTASAYATPAQFELAVSSAASLLGYGIRERISIGLVCLDSQSEMFLPAENLAERQQMIHYLIDINGEGRGPLIPRLEKLQRMMPRGAYFLLISPQTGSPVLETFRWAESRGMTPAHLQILSAPSERKRAEWPQELKARGIPGYRAASLQELPAVLGGEGPT